MHNLSIICGAITGIITLYFTFRLFFSDSEDFWEAIRFWFTPDSFSFLNGEYWEDCVAEFKLGLWVFIGGGAGYLTATGIQTWIIS